MTIRLDFALMMAPRIPSGATEREWREVGARFGVAHADVAREAAAGRYGFLELEAQAAELTRVREFARAAHGRYEDVVVLGIGGSALGSVALRGVLGSVFAGPRLHVVDNVDPKSFAALLKQLDFARTLFCVVSKSGTTVETLAQYALVRTELEKDHRPVARHFAFVTDPAAGPLRDIAQRAGIPTFDIPPNVGGRFSVLSPVGTLPAALAGYDVAALVAGAKEMRDRCEVAQLDKNPAGVFAMLQWRAHQKAGQGIHVMMPYSDALRDVAPWFAQLWAESLGKVDADGLNVGPTPLAARGVTDQHSQLQLFMEGPADKTVTFLVERRRDADLRLPDGPGLPPALDHLRGRTLGDLLSAEQRATAEGLAGAGRPSMTLELEQCDARETGALMMLLMKATIYAGALYRVNPLDQPGVEIGKRLAREALAKGKGAPTGATRWTV